MTLALSRRLRDLLGALIGLSWLAGASKLWKITPEAIPVQKEATYKL